MFCLLDARLPRSIQQALSHYAELILLATQEIVYPAISGHPDIFFCKTPKRLIAAANTPEFVLNQLSKNSIAWEIGYSPLGAEYPATCHYNAVTTENTLIHCLHYTDPMILKEMKNTRHIFVKQGYTRCSLLPLDDRTFLTSDSGIHQILNSNLSLNCVYTHPKTIQLPGFSHGFIGGCAGTVGKNIFFTGSLHSLSEGKQLRIFFEQNEWNIIELSSGPMIDGGSLIFLEPEEKTNH